MRKWDLTNTCLVVLMVIAGALPAAAQGFDNSGNGQLNGAYYFREVSYTTDQSGNVSDGVSAYGNISFSGNGAYSITVANVFDLAQGSLQQYSLTGTYTISAGGYGFLSSPNTILSGAPVYGLVSNGIFIGSSTENGLNDFMVAAPVPSSTPDFNGNYSLSYLSFLNFQPAAGFDALIAMSPGGSGIINSFNLTYYQTSNTPGTLNETGVKYVVSNGAVALSFPNNSNYPITGQEYLYISPDGNFVFGGSPTDIDMFVGVRTGSPPAYGGIYYQAGLDLNESNLGNGTVDFGSYYGSYFTTSAGDIIGHQRIVFDSGGALSFTYPDTYPVGTSGTYTNTSTSLQYVSGNSGIVIGLGIGPFLGINVALPAPALSGSGVFLNPEGIVNAASFAPFTAGVAPREYLTLFGTGLAAAPAVAPGLPYPTTLGNVQVLVNNVAAPLSYVSPTQINLLVPYGIPESAGSVVQIQVKNGDTLSNPVTEFVYHTAAGVFSDTANGLGHGAVLHNSDFSLVTTDNPAKAGEAVDIFLTGLGDVFPNPPDGAPGPSPPAPLSKTTVAPAVGIGGMGAPGLFSGQAPGLAGYQIDVTVPSGLTAGDNVLQVSGADSSTVETLIPVAGSANAAPARAAAVPSGPPRQRPARAPKAPVIEPQK